MYIYMLAILDFFTLGFAMLHLIENVSEHNNSKCYTTVKANVTQKKKSSIVILVSHTSIHTGLAVPQLTYFTKQVNKI